MCCESDLRAQHQSTVIPNSWHTHQKRVLRFLSMSCQSSGLGLHLLPDTLLHLPGFLLELVLPSCLCSLWGWNFIIQALFHCIAFWVPEWTPIYLFLGENRQGQESHLYPSFISGVSAKPPPARQVSSLSLRVCHRESPVSCGLRALLCSSAHIYTCSCPCPD